ncbi:CDP-glucose 4,6-dehydratase [Candidatus Pelagibacter sp.]|nr:CDP-glucose 4,6-dehydratase [Candidatus Pelagibacter sp.]
MKNKKNFVIYKNFFNKKRILITGNTGFVGSNLSIALKLMGSKILGYSLKKKDTRYLSNNAEYRKKIKTIYGDIINIDKNKNNIKKFKPQILIHLASQPIVSESYSQTKKNYETNVMGTVKLLELAKDLKYIKNIIIFTSDKVYKNLEKNELSEKSSLGGDDPYSASKSSQDLISNSYKTSFFKSNKNIFIIRAGNILGGGDWEKSRLIPDLFLSNEKKKNIFLRNPNAIRPWQHIFDVMDGIFKLVSNKGKKIAKSSHIYNIGPKNNLNLTVKSLIKIFLKKSNLTITYKIKKINFNEKKILRLSSKSIMHNINWRPNLKMNQIIKLTCDWYANFFKNKKMIYKFTEKQIKLYFNI